MTNQCQSCAMPLTNPEDYGKNTDGTPSADYCCHCYPAGAFNNPNETLEEMINSCAPFMADDPDCPFYNDLAGAKNYLGETLPNFKRWKTA